MVGVEASRIITVIFWELWLKRASSHLSQSCRRQAPDASAPPKAIKQLAARPGLWYTVIALRTALFRRLDLVFCGHLFMAPLALLIARLKGARLIVQMHGIEAWPRPSWVQRFAV
jgi:phosphatidylinositol alpha-1,6-mannosyltransferase